MTYGTLNVDSVVSSNGVTSGGLYGFKNRIINGAMTISQRGTTFSGLTDGSNGTYTIDRWAWGETGTSTGVQTVSQDTSAPTGFINSLKVQTTTAHSVGTGNWYNAYQYIEGLNCTDLAWGTASAASVTLSFWVRSSLTGTFAGVLQNSAFDKSYVFNYTISVADTWEQKTITVAGPTSGTWLTTNGRGIRIAFDLGAGSTYQTTANTWASGNYGSSSGAVSVAGTLNATWYVTGVQLEKGSTATSFDYRPYGTELVLCQRYYQLFGGAGAASTASLIDIVGIYTVPMRAVASAIGIRVGTNGCVASNRPIANVTSVNSIWNSGNEYTVGLRVTSSDTGMTGGMVAWVFGGVMTASAEL